MMAEWLQWLVLALVQGLTEFLPISSSAHLILASKLAGWQDQGLVMDIAAHLGSLLAVMMYYRQSIARLLTGQDWPLFLQLLLASFPIALAGLLFANIIETQLRSVWVIAIASAVFGVLLWLSQRWSKAQAIDLKKAGLIGLAQCLALIPGASRSGVTMTAAMAMGIDKQTAARFSFLLAIPAILMTTAYGGMKLMQAPQNYDLSGILVVVTGSFLAAWLCIHWFMKFIDRINFVWFMHYRILLAVMILMLWQ